MDNDLTKAPDWMKQIMKYPAPGPRLLAVVGFAAGIHLTNPRIASMVETSDGFVMTRVVDRTTPEMPDLDGPDVDWDEVDASMGRSSLFGMSSDLRRNWDGLLAHCQLDEEQTAAANKALRARYRDHYGNPALPTA